MTLDDLEQLVRSYGEAEGAYHAWGGPHRKNLRDARLKAILDAIREMHAALRDAAALIHHADTKGCSPWCNGVHEQGCCEGTYYAGPMIDRVLKLAGMVKA